MTASKMTTARMAAVTSLTIPSVSSAAATRSRAGTTSRIGVMTVGPVATSSAPIRNARFQETAAELNANYGDSGAHECDSRTDENESERRGRSTRVASKRR